MPSNTVPAEDAYIDPAVIRRAVAGDRDAFGRIYTATHERIYRYAYTHTHGRRQLAEDITGETYLRALRRISAFQVRDGKHIAAWLVTITRNLIADHYKSAGHRLETLVDDLRGDPHTDIDHNTGREYDSVEVVDTVRAAIATLTTAQRFVIIMRYCHDRSIDETSQAMSNVDLRDDDGKCVANSEGAIKALTYRGARQLREQLAGLI